MIEFSQSTISGLWSVAGSIALGLIGWLGGAHKGRGQGRAEFIDAVERAARLVIEKLEVEVAKVSRMHEECEKNSLDLRTQMEELKEGQDGRKETVDSGS